jgi:hypothetical protein
MTVDASPKLTWLHNTMPVPPPPLLLLLLQVVLTARWPPTP